MATTKTMTLRIPTDLYKQIVKLADADREPWARPNITRTVVRALASYAEQQLSGNRTKGARRE